MLATHTATRMELVLPSVVRLHEETDDRVAATVAPALSFHQQATAQQAITALRQLDTDTTGIYYLFVTDLHERLVGVVSLLQLLNAAPGARLFEFMDRRVITLSLDATLKEQARLMSETGLFALPVVDEQSRLLGAMSTCELVRAMQDESTSEMYQMAGISQHESVDPDDSRPALPALAHRALWLLASLPLAMFIGWLLGGMIGPANPVASLMCFAPLVILLGLLAARQTQTFVVRSLTLGYLRLSATRALLNRELANAAVVGAWVGSVTTLIGWLWFGTLIPALVLGGAVLGSILLASLAGLGVPLLWKANNVTPATVSAFVVLALSTTASAGCLICLSWLAQSLGYL